MLIGNRSVLLKSPGRYIGGSTVSDNRSNFGTSGGTRGRYFGGFPAINATPSGYRPPYSWVIAIKNGEMSSTNDAGLQLGTAANLVGGVTANAPASLTLSVADAAGQLISSGAGSAAMTFTVADLLLTASIGGIGSASLTLATNSPLLGAKASGQGTATFAVTGSLTPYAIGAMTGSTVDAGVLTIDAIAAGVLAAALAAPIRANIKQVNDVAVTGTGATGDEWGP